MKDEVKIPLPCPECGHETALTDSWFLAGVDAFVCSGCGEQVELDERDMQLVAEAFCSVERGIQRVRDAFTQ